MDDETKLPFPAELKLLEFVLGSQLMAKVKAMYFSGVNIRLAAGFLARHHPQNGCLISEEQRRDIERVIRRARHKYLDAKRMPDSVPLPTTARQLIDLYCAADVEG